MTDDIINGMEWVKFKDWNLLANDDCNWVSKKRMDLFLSGIISLCAHRLDYDKKFFEKIFKNRNKAFFEYKRELFKYNCSIYKNDGKLIILKELLIVPCIGSNVELK